jgi:hypothetical protein
MCEFGKRVDIDSNIRILLNPMFGPRHLNMQADMSSSAHVNVLCVLMMILGWSSEDKG